MRLGYSDSRDSDISLRVEVAAPWAEIVGVLLMDRLGPFEEERGDARVTLVFYPGEDAATEATVISLLSPGMVAEAGVSVERQRVPRDWVDGWRDHFHPVVIGGVRVRPPWEQPLGRTDSLMDVVINPGLGFGTGLHPTTRGTLTLLQEGDVASRGAGAARGTGTTCGAGATHRGYSSLGALVDCGTGSGILSIAAAKLGWGPVVAFDNDGDALLSARENVEQNGVEDQVEVFECDLLEAPLSWFEGATVLANMTLKPVLMLLDKLKGLVISRIVVSGILAGEQESQLVGEASSRGLAVGLRLYEAEWVSMELQPGVASGGD